MSDTPQTDAEARRMTIDCDDSCVEIYVQQDGKTVEGDIVLADFARQLEQQLNDAKRELQAWKMAAADDACGCDTPEALAAFINCCNF